MAFVSNYFFRNFGNEPWRWMVGIEALPSILYLIGVWTIPKSPRWLIIKKNKVKEAQKIFFDITKSDMPKRMLNKLISEQNDVHNQNLFIKKFSLPILLAFLFALFNQLSGINAFLYYAPRIFESAGLESSSALLGTIGIGITNLIFTLLGLYLIDKAGRKLLMYIGSIGYIVSLTLVSLAFINSWEGLSVPLFLFIFIASHAIGQGAVIWVFISEIFPNKLRAKGQSLGSSVHWILAAIITLVMPTALSYFNNPGYVFIFFAFMMVLQLFFVAFMMPETKGISLEDLSEKLSS
jgi:sugar porter (SP) family MFS transporter